MRILRRVFVESAVALGVVAMAGSVFLATAGSDPAWLGVGLAWLPIVGYLLYLLVAKPSTRTRHLWILYVIALVGLVISAFAGLLAVAIAAAGLATLLAYPYWYSRQHVPAATIKVGTKIPRFPLVSLDGSEVSSDIFATGSRVIMFYRGNWCPFCMVQVRHWPNSTGLERRGVGVALISPQRAGETVELANRFDIPMEFYVDRDGAAA